MVTHIKQAQVLDIIGMRNRGLSQANIAQRQGISYTTLRRYIRVFDLYGIEAFAEE